MRGSWSRRLAMMGVGATALVFSLAPGGTVLAAGSSAGSVKPNATNQLDCNGHSSKYAPVKVMGSLCTDPIRIGADGTYRFLDNGNYIGHDEPSVKFISSQPGSANNINYIMRLSSDPKGTPTVNSPKVSKYAELSPAPWFGLPICDPRSYPQNPCTPDSDTNQGQINNPNGAGSAFMELQFYPPGFQPFQDGISCSATKWCAAVNIDSLACTFNFVTCNGACIEPVNFAYLQLNGVPAGPPSPQLTDASTFLPNAKTLEMNEGDTLTVTTRDTPQGMVNSITDLSTGQTGFMVASGANGFMNTNIADCSGTPFNFHPEYSSAQQQNQVPWAALEAGVLMQDELGHFEACSSVSNSLPFSSKGLSDPQVFQTCNGGNEGGSPGEGPCDPNTGICANATTEGGQACPTNDFTTSALCEFSDANCMPQGPRQITIFGTKTETVRWPIAACQDNTFQNGDLDFDGTSYQADWPDGSKGHPTSFQYIGPFTGGGSTYPTVQYETDLAASEIQCNIGTGAGCTAPPLGPGNKPTFYPFWTIGSLFGGGGAHPVCVWNFGNVIPGTTLQSFGGPAEYGTPDVARFGGTLTSAPLPNPQFSGSCLH